MIHQQGHLAELQDGIPFIFQPGITFRSEVRTLRMLAIFSRIGESEVFYLF